MEQRTDEWFQARLGKVTASMLGAVTAKIKTGESATRKSYKIQLITERLTGKKTDTYINAAMQHGIDTEDEAKLSYIMAHGEVEEAPFVDHPIIPMTGASPDGYVGEDGLIEIKCPQANTHTETLLTGKFKKNYLYQMQWQMACTGRKWCDFVSYNGSFPEHLQMYVQRVERDDKLIKELEDEVIEFLNEVGELMEKMNDSTQDKTKDKE